VATEDERYARDGRSVEMVVQLIERPLLIFKSEVLPLTAQGDI
jgi:hypothetical protein